MNKLQSIAVIASFFLASAVYAGSKNVTITIPGTLHKSFSSTEQISLSDLSIYGALNSADVCFLRRLCGNDSLFKPVSPMLNIGHLNLSKVSFVPDSTIYATGNKGKHYRITGKNSLPAFFFYGCNVDRVTLPESLDSIGYRALSHCKLQSIDIPDGVYVDPTAVYADSMLTHLRLPAMASGLAPSQMVLPRLRTVHYGDMDYMSSGAFNNLPEIEEIVFEGNVGHIDGYTVTNCPKLKRIIFKGAINSTGGPQFVKDCPELEEVRFEGLIGYSSYSKPINCPKLNEYTITGAIMGSDDSTYMPQTSVENISKRPEMVKQMHHLLNWQTQTLISPSNSFLRRVIVIVYPYTKDTTFGVANVVGFSDLYAEFEKAIEIAKQSDDVRSKLEILKASPAYKSDDKEYSFTYAQPSDSLLTLSRQYFNLDSIAGNGDDISKIKNLLYWVHDLVRHDGTSGGWPDCGFNLRELKKVCQEQNRGLNCRFMAMMLTEALLAEGIPARYLTCQSKAWDTDNDCHVICVAWSESLGKWVWVDPTFAAFVTDENGVMLHPGEVRYRLQHDMPLILNEDANWNHEVIQTKKNYLDNYMAKNLYIISANTINQAEPEGETHHPKGKYVALVPEGSNYTNAQIITTDDDKFWQSPE